MSVRSDEVHHRERKAFREDTPLSQLPWRTQLRTHGSKSGGCRHGFTELISEPLLVLFVVGNLLEKLVLRFLEKANRLH